MQKQKIAIGICLDHGIEYQIKDGVLWIQCKDQYPETEDCCQLVNIMTCGGESNDAAIIDIQNLRVGMDGQMRFGK